MIETWNPSNDYQGLSSEYLRIVGDVIRKARAGAFYDHHPEHGETNWSLGCRSYERTTTALTWAANTYPWLTILAGGIGPAHFVMSIGGHPVRFCSGDPDTLPMKYLQLSFAESLGFLPAGRALRITIEPGIAGPADIHLVEINEETGMTTQSYLIPEIAHETNVIEFVPQAETVELPPVSAQPIDSEATTDESTNTGFK